MSAESPTTADTLPHRSLVEDEVEVTARQLVRWPAIWLFLVGVLNCATVAAVVLYQIAALRNSSRGFVDQALLTALLPAGLCMIGALRLGSLRSRPWAYISAVTAMISGPLFILGLPIGIWTLTRLGRPEVVAGFDRHSRFRAAKGVSDAGPPTFGLELTRVLIIALMWLMAIAIPLVSYVLAQDSGAFPNIGVQEKTILSFTALAVIFGLAATLKHLERRRKAASGKSEIRSTIARQIRRVPEVLVCSMLGVFTMQAIYADLTALHYDRFMEAVIIPLFCVTLATLGIVVFINRRRIRELTASGQEDPELTSAYRTAIAVPLGLMVPVTVLLAVWGYRQTTVGYVAFDVENSMSTVSFRNVETDQMRSLSASWKRVRLPAGTYEWSVSAGPIQNMVIDSGTIEVQPRVGQLISTRIDKAEALRRIVGTWKYVSGNVQWDASNGPAPDWAQPPSFLGISPYAARGNHTIVLMTTDEIVADFDDGMRGYACEFRADTTPGTVSLFAVNGDIDPKDWPCVAQGYWQVGRNGLYLILGPAGELRLPNTYSVPTDRFVRYQFEQVLEESIPEESLVESSEDEIRQAETELRRRIQPGTVSTRVLAVKPARAGDRMDVEISAGSDDGFHEGDDLMVFRTNPNGTDEYVAKIRLTRLRPDRSVGIVIERTKGKSVEVGDCARPGGEVATNGNAGEAADDMPQINLPGEDRFQTAAPQDSE